MLLLTRLLFRGGRISAASRSSTSSRSGGSRGRADVSQQFADVLSLQGLGEQAWPVAFNCVSASLDDLLELFFLNAKTCVVRQTIGVDCTRMRYLQ